MTASELISRVLKGVNEDATTPVYYSRGEVMSALSDVQEMFVLLTLCLETTGTLTVSSTWTRAMDTFSDFLCPLRIRRAGGKVRPATLKDLDARDRSWQAATGAPTHYAMCGFELLATYPTTATSEALAVTYARCPVRLAADADVPEIRAEYHEALVDGAIPILRVKEGAQELGSSLHRFRRFLDAAKDCGEKTRAKYAAAQYDRLPPEIRMADLSAITKPRWQTTLQSRRAPAAQSPQTT